MELLVSKSSNKDRPILVTISYTYFFYLKQLLFLFFLLFFSYRFLFFLSSPVSKKFITEVKKINDVNSDIEI